LLLVACGGGSSSPPSQGPAHPDDGGSGSDDGGSGSDDASGLDAAPRGDGATGAADSPAGSDIFSDPHIPTCPQGNSANGQIAGTIAGQAVSIMEPGALSSNLAGGSYQAILSMGTYNTGYTIWYPLELTWSGALAEGQATPLTGGQILVMPSAPSGTAYCITSGDIGPEPLASDAAVGRVFRFRVTGLQAGSVPDGGSTATCSGPPVSASLFGCIYRTKTYL
jgi:hypothetical protein